MEKLVKRLRAVAALIPPGKKVADIGTDHAMLPIFLIQSETAAGVIASDINKGPFQRAKTIVHLQGLEDFIDIRLGNGLKVLEPGEVQVIVISGLGGFTIVDIFNECPQVLEKVETLVLSPATHESEVRRWLKEKGWQIKDEDLVEDQNRIYQIIQACPNGNHRQEEWTELEYDVGPIIIKKRHPLLKEYLERKLKKYEQAVNSLMNSQSLESAKKTRSLRNTMEELCKLIDLLPNARRNNNGNMSKGD